MRGSGRMGLSPFVFWPKAELQIKKSKINPNHRQVKKCFGFVICSFKGSV
jgi:hypothetical protein